MKKIYGRIFSLLMTAVLAASYFYDFSYGLTFVSVIFWATVVLVGLVCIPILVIHSKFDDNELGEKECEKHFGEDKKRSLISTIYNLLATVLQVCLLVLLGSPVLAAFYLIANIISAGLLSGTNKRCIIWEGRKSAI